MCIFRSAKDGGGRGHDRPAALKTGMKRKDSEWSVNIPWAHLSLSHEHLTTLLCSMQGGCRQDPGKNLGAFWSSRRPANSDCKLAGGDWEGLCCFEGKPTVAWYLIFSDSVSIKHCKRLRRNHKIQLKPAPATPTLGKPVGAWSQI